MTGRPNPSNPFRDRTRVQGDTMCRSIHAVRSVAALAAIGAVPLVALGAGTPVAATPLFYADSFVPNV